MKPKFSPQELQRVQRKMTELYAARRPLVQRDESWRGPFVQLKIVVPKGPYRRRRLIRLLERWAKG